MGEAMGALQREGDVYSDEEYDVGQSRRIFQQSTPQRPQLGKTATTAALSRRERREEEDDDDDDDRALGQDDEVLIRDRGEDLIRKRMRERKKAKRLASASANNAAREVRARDFATFPATQPQTPFLASNDGYNDNSFPGGSLSSVPPTPRMNADDRRAGSIGRATSVSRTRTGGRMGASASTPGTGNLPTDSAAYDYFPPYTSKGTNTAFSAGSRPGPLRQQQEQPPNQPQQQSSYEDDVVEEISTPTALEATVPSKTLQHNGGDTVSSSASAVDWDFLGPSDRGKSQRQARQPYSTSSFPSRSQSRAASVMSDVISDVVREAEERQSARGGDSRRMSEDEEGDEEDGVEDGDDMGEDDDEDNGDEDDEDEEGVTMRDRQDVRINPYALAAMSRLTCCYNFLIGHQHRTSIWSSHLETSIIQEIAVCYT